MITVPNYVDQDVFSKIKFDTCTESNKLDKQENKRVVLFIGRLNDQKNLFSLIDAYNLSEYANKLIIIGQGEDLNKLEKKASFLSKSVEFVGPIPNNKLPFYLKQANVFILPSLYEGLPKTLLEAMSCGVPCIGTDVEGIQEVITNGKDGVLCATDFKSIANALDLVLSDSELANELGNQAHLTIKEKYSLEKVLEIEKSIYKRILNS